MSEQTKRIDFLANLASFAWKNDQIACIKLIRDFFKDPDSLGSYGLKESKDAYENLRDAFRNHAHTNKLPLDYTLKDMIELLSSRTNVEYLVTAEDDNFECYVYRTNLRGDADEMALEWAARGWTRVKISILIAEAQEKKTVTHEIKSVS